MKYLFSFSLSAKPVLLFVTATWLLLSVCSCTEDRFLKEVDVDLENPEIDLVLESTIRHTDTIITVYFSTSQSILEQVSGSLISGASVELFLNDVSQGLLEEVTVNNWRDNQPGSIYQLGIDSAQIKAGDQVRIEASTPSGERVSAIEQMPNAANLVSVTYFQDRQTPGYYYSNNSIRVVIDDPSNEDNFYIFEAESRYFDAFQYGSNPVDTFYAFESIFLDPADEFAQGTFLDYPISNDRTYNGREITITLGAGWEPRMTFFGEDTPLFFTVSSINKSGYDFDETLDAVISSEGNPFAEPAILPSSIEGGRGVLRLINDAATIQAALE